MISKQTGWSAKSNALYEIMKQLDRMISISSKWLNGDFHQNFTTTTTTTIIITVQSVSLDESAIYYAIGDTFQLTATVLPANASDKTVTWSSDDEAVATVVNGLVTFVGHGTCTITVTTTDGSFTDTCGVTSVILDISEEVPAWSSAEVDALLALLATEEGLAYLATLDTPTINLRNNDPRTAGSDTDFDTLIAAGVQILEDIAANVVTDLVSSFDIDNITGVVGWTDTNGGAAEYEVYSATNGGADVLIATTAAGATSYQDAACKQIASVVYKVRAKKGANFSALVSATAIEVPLCLKTNQSTLSRFTFNRLDIPTGKSVTISWGDGTSTTLTAGNAQAPFRDYAATGQYNVSVTGMRDGCSYFYIGSQSHVYGDISNYLLPTVLLRFFIINCQITGSIPECVAGNTYLDIQLLTNRLSGSNITKFRNGMVTFNVATQAVSFPTTEIDKLLKAIADWFEVNAPTANCTISMTGANMGIPTGGANNTDRLRIIQYWTAAGFTATVNVRTS